MIGFPKDPKELFKECNNQGENSANNDCAMYRELEQKGYTVLKDVAKSKEGY